MVKKKKAPKIIMTPLAEEQLKELPLEDRIAIMDQLKDMLSNTTGSGLHAIDIDLSGKKKNKPFKVLMHPDVAKDLENIPEEDRKMIQEFMKNLAKNLGEGKSIEELGGIKITNPDKKNLPN